MPRRRKAPEYNKPEIDYILLHFGKAHVQRKREQLCKACLHEDCLLLPITTKGEDCPYRGTARKFKANA